MLPDDFQWDPENQWRQHWLRCGRVIVAGVSMTAFAGIWIGSVNRHEERSANYAYAYFGKREVALRMAERWACACAVRVRHEILTGSRRRPPERPASRDEKRVQRQLRG